ncbi:MAG: hypothetical protein FWF01_00090 [Alphaproteobacteria bacterium]|nr:hypothetical protein [Alphaproteobacteria bacterium]
MSRSTPSAMSALAAALSGLAQTDDRVVVVTTGNPAKMGFNPRAKRMDGRVLSFPASPALAASCAIELLHKEYRPFLLMPDSYVYEAYAMIVEAVACSLPLGVCLFGAGLDPGGISMHKGADLAAVSRIPDLVVAAPSGMEDVCNMLMTMYGSDCPMVMRFSSDMAGGCPSAAGTAITIGTGRVVRKGSRVAMLNFGALLPECLKACNALAGRGIIPTVVDMRFVKPLDLELLTQQSLMHQLLVIVEDSVGSVGSLALEFLANNGFMDHGLKVRTVKIPEGFFAYGDGAQLKAQAGVNPQGIIMTVLDALDDVDGNMVV